MACTKLTLLGTHVRILASVGFVHSFAPTLIQTILKDIIAAGHEGLSGPSDATLRVVEFGLDMLDVIKSTRCPEGIQLQMRLGIHTGSCYSGVVGNKGEIVG